MSNAFERRRETPLLGMEKFVNRDKEDADEELVDEEVAAMLRKKINGLSALVIAGAAPAEKVTGPDICRSETHGGFDNDTFTLNSVLFRILGEAPARPLRRGTCSFSDAIIFEQRNTLYLNLRQCHRVI